MQISNISQYNNQSFGIRYCKAMSGEIDSIYKTLRRNHAGYQPEFLESIINTLKSIIPDGFLDYKVSCKGLLGLKKEKQCYLFLPKSCVMLWNKESGLFSKNKAHLTVEDISEIADKLNALNITA